MNNTNMYRDISPDRFRQVMGSFCSGVTVITASTLEGPVGFTCQSFTSLSLDPPLITFNPKRSSSSWPKIREIGSFCVNILSADSEHMSRVFAKSGTDKFADIAYTLSERGNPIIDGCLAWIDCEIHAEHDGGDHSIVVGRVDNMHARDDVDPLLFFRGQYASLRERSIST